MAERAVRAARVDATAALLRDLLAHDRTYRSRWLARAQRFAGGPDDVHYGAVAAVIVARVRGDDLASNASSRTIRDRVSRALRAKTCSATTLRWFVESFDMRQEHSTALSRTFQGQRGEHIASGAMTWPELPVDPHRTLTLSDFHFIGADRKPRRHRTVQVIEAAADGYATYPYRFDTPNALVFVEAGGSAGPVHSSGAGLWAVDIELIEPLQAGDTANVVYDTVFSYDEPPEPAFKRGALSVIRNVSLNVTFDPAALPVAIWWTVWTGDQESPSTRESVQLGRTNTVHRFVDRLERSVAGFTWVW